MIQRVAAAVTLLVFAGCAVWPLGQDPAGRKLEAEGERLAVAIQAYRSGNGDGPNSIDELIPKFLSRTPDRRLHFDAMKNRIEFVYSPTIATGEAVCVTAVDT